MRYVMRKSGNKKKKGALNMGKLEVRLLDPGRSGRREPRFVILA